MDLSPLYARYPADFRPENVEPPPAGEGFSGAVVLRVRCPAGVYCFRGWPERSLPVERIRGLHRLLEHVSHCGVSQVAVPVADRNGSTLVEFADRFWQLEPWMPGTADFHQHPSDARLHSAMKCLAAWHRAAASFDPPADSAEWFASQPASASPAVAERLRMIRAWSHGKLQHLSQQVSQDAECEFRRLALEIIDHFARAARPVADQLQAVERQTFPLQPCLRDVWHDHVLFIGDDVTGLIDPSACRAENVVTDLARLLGSFLADDHPRWQVALDEYQRHRPLSLDEQALLPILDRSGVLLSPMTWLERYYLDGQRFRNPARVGQRLEAILPRLQRLAESLRGITWHID